jgi:hypothetical protein
MNEEITGRSGINTNLNSIIFKTLLEIVIGSFWILDVVDIILLTELKDKFIPQLYTINQILRLRSTHQMLYVFVSYLNLFVYLTFY